MPLIEPYYPKAGNRTQPMPLERMLRIYFMQTWFNLSDPEPVDALYDSESMRRLAGFELAEDRIPDETTILRFRHLLEKHQLREAIFAQIRSLLEEKRLLLKSGTIVDATIIAAPSSTKNAEKARDPKMRQTKKGKDKRGIVQTLVTTPANEADISQLPQQKSINRARSRVHARGEHAFHVAKRLWGLSKVRYRGLAKNTARLFTAFALANPYLLQRRLLPPREACVL